MVMAERFIPPSHPRFWDPAVFCPTTKIKTKSRGIQWFDLWSHQQVLAAATWRAYQTGHWLAHVKPRQEGSSTIFTAVATQHACFRQGCKVAIIAHTKKVAGELAKMAVLFHHSIDPRIRPRTRPNLKRGLDLTELNSELMVASVQDDEPLRGETCQVLLATEIGSWAECGGQDAWVSALSAVPDDGGFVIAESTPKHFGDEMNLLHTDAQQVGSKWLCVFIPWTHVQEYAKEPPPGWKPNADVRGYLDKHPGIGDQQAFWMQTVGLEKVRGRMDKFMAEYPVDIAECWQMVGDSVFDSDRLRTRRQELDGGTGLTRELVDYVEYEAPVKGRRYVIACDPAGSWSKRDSHGIQVLDLWTCEQVAEFRGYGTAWDIARRIAELSRRYNRATVYVEANGVGEAVLIALVTPTSEAYCPMVFSRRESTGGGNGILKPGWWSSGKSKGQAIGYLQELIRDGSIVINSLRLLEQLDQYRGQWSSGGRDAGGGHFDLVSSMAIAAWAWYQEGGGLAAHAARPKTEADVVKAALRRLGVGLPTSDNTPWGNHL